MDWAIYVCLFVGATVLVAAEPGPGFVKLSAETAARGTRFARVAALGMALGALPHVAVVALGLHALIAALPGVLTVLKVVGFCYIAWQAWSLLRGPAEGGGDNGRLAADAAKQTGSRHRMRDSLSSGFLLALLNPRTPTFFAAYLPLFLRHDLSLPISDQLLVLGVLVVVIFLAVDMVFIALARRAAGRLAANGLFKRLARYLGASLLGLFGLRLLLSRE